MVYVLPAGGERIRISDVNQWSKSAGIGVFSSKLNECGLGEELNVLSTLRKGERYSERQKEEKGMTPSFAISCLTIKSNSTLELDHFTNPRFHEYACSPLAAMNVVVTMFPNAEIATRAGRAFFALSSS